jgi:hypothetical protein
MAGMIANEFIIKRMNFNDLYENIKKYHNIHLNNIKYKINDY